MDRRATGHVGVEGARWAWRTIAELVGRFAFGPVRDEARATDSAADTALVNGLADVEPALGTVALRGDGRRRPDPSERVRVDLDTVGRLRRLLDSGLERSGVVEHRDHPGPLGRDVTTVVARLAELAGDEDR